MIMPTEIKDAGVSSINVWVVTVNWNQPKLTCQCIESLRENTDLIFSLVIVDNGSTDDSIDQLRQIAPDKLLLIENNIGFAGGFNAGIKYGLAHGAEYIFMVNNDTIAQHKMLDILVETAVELDADIAAPAIFYLDSPQKIWSTGGRISPLLSAPINSHSRNQPLPAKPVKREFFSGCALLIKKDAFSNNGYFDESFFLYYEDLDFFIRAKHAALNTWLIPQAKLLHHVSGSITQANQDDFFYWMGYSSWHYYLKHLKFWQWLFVLPWRIGHAIKLVIELIFIGRFAAIKGYLKGNFDRFKHVLSKDHHQVKE